MKVKELIEQLQKHDPEKIVVVDGYETGFDEVKTVDTRYDLIKLKDDKPYYDGEYQESTALTWVQDLTNVVYLPRSS
jgi:hypothetical protein